MSKEAMKLALRALRFANDDGYKNEVSQEAITALKEALAKQEQGEPVAWMSEDEYEVYTSKQVDGYFQHDHIPLYTTPQQRKPMTDAHLYLESLVDALDGAFISTWQSTAAWQTQLDEAKDYLAAHGIKE